MKWLIKLSNKPWSFGLAIFTLLTIVFWVVFYVPVSISVRNFIVKYTSVYDDRYPTLKLSNGKVSMTGTIPFVNKPEENVYAIFDTTHEIKKIPEDAGNGSFFITQDSFQVLYKNKLRAYAFKDFKMDDFVLSAHKARKTANWINGPFLIITGLIGFALVWIAGLVWVVIASGIILMIDAFSGESFILNHPFNLSVLALIPVWLLFFLKQLLAFTLFKPFLLFNLIYLAMIIMITLLVKKVLMKERQTHCVNFNREIK